METGTFRCKACNSRMNATPPLFSETLCPRCRHKAYIQDDMEDYGLETEYVNQITEYMPDDPMAINNESEFSDFFDNTLNIWDNY